MTAVLIALLVAVQFVTAPLGQFVTGSLVNLILIVSAMTIGLSSGLTIAAVSPVVAATAGVGPVVQLVPFIIVGNVTLVLAWGLICKLKYARTGVKRAAAAVTAAVCKSIALYFGVVRIAIPYILSLPEQKAAQMSIMFSIPQLITALLGGAAAVMILPAIEKARTARAL